MKIENLNNIASNLTAESRAIEVVNELVTAGADLNHKNKEGLTPLMVALGDKQYKLAKLLIGLGADVNLKDSDGYNAIRYVFVERDGKKYFVQADKNRQELLILLVAKGLSIDTPIMKGITAKDNALKNGAVKTIKFLEELPALVASMKKTEQGKSFADSAKQLSVDDKSELNVLKKTDIERSSVSAEVVEQSSTSLSLESEVDPSDAIYKTALSYIKRSRLSKPKGDSALDKLNELSALTSDSDPRVVELRQKIADKYLNLAQRRKNDFRYTDAMKYVETSQTIQSSKKAILLMAELKEKIAEEKKFQSTSYSSNKQTVKQQPKSSQAGDSIKAIGNVFKSIFN